MLYIALTLFLMFVSFYLGLFIGIATAKSEEKLDDFSVRDVDEIIRKNGI